MRVLLTAIIAGALILNGCDREEDDRLDPLTDSPDPARLETADATGEAPLTRDQFTRRFQAAGRFDSWDADRDRRLTRQEFARGLARTWDRDADGRITEREWDGAAAVWFGTADYGAWYDWDRNDDAVLTSDEVARGIDRYGLYDQWDAGSSGMIEIDEFYDRWFEIVDDDGDGQIEPPELEEYIHHLEPTPI